MSSIQRWTVICNKIHHKLLAAESKHDEVLAKLSQIPPVPIPTSATPSACESLDALKVMFETQSARHELLRPFQPTHADGQLPLDARQIAEVFVNELRDNHRSTEMLAEQLHRILPTVFELTTELERVLLTPLEKIVQVKYHGLRAFLECTKQQLQRPSFLSDMSSVDEYVAKRYEAHELASASLLHLWQSDEYCGKGMWITEATVDLPRQIKQYGVFERQLLRLLVRVDKAGLRISRQTMITEFIHVEINGVQWILREDPRVYRARPRVPSA